MKGLLAFALLAATVAGAPPLLDRDEGDDDCSMVWVTIYTDSSSGTSTSAASISTSAGHSSAYKPDSMIASTLGTLSTAEATLTPSSPPSTAESSLPSTSAAPSSLPNSTSDTSSALDLPNRPDGSAPIPVNDDHLSAPVAADAVPAGAALYTPATAGVFNCTDFAGWMTKQRDTKLASRWMKVAPGTYRYALGTVMPEGTDANTVVGENIAIGFTPGGWTLDLRGVTFFVDITPENHNQRPGDIIYINQSEDFTILGGTVWIDQGEEFTQARVTSMTAPDTDGNSVATIEVEQGYNVSIWASAGPRNQACVDDSDPNHYTRPGCNFWYASKYDFSELESKRTFTAQFASRSNMQKGYVITMDVLINSVCTISTENNGGFHIKGFTSNGYVASIGLNGKVAPIYEDVYYVNPPPRPGYAPRVNGPGLSWGNLGGFIYDAPGQEKASLPGSYWQTSGSSKDLQAATNSTVPS